MKFSNLLIFQLIFTLLFIAEPSLANPVLIQGPECTEYQIDGGAKYSLQKLSEVLTEDEIRILNQRRQLILQKFSNALSGHLHKLGILKTLKLCLQGKFTRPSQHSKEMFVQTLHFVDSLLIRKAKEVANCSQWGTCVSAGLFFGVGAHKLTTGIGVFYTLDYVRTLGQPTQKNSYLEFNFPYFAKVPSLDLGAVVRFYVHLDGAIIESQNDLEITQLPVAPIIISGKNTTGFGAQTGVALPPWIAAAAHIRSKILRIPICSKLLKRNED